MAPNLRASRRGVLAALGAGTILTAAGGATMAQEGDDEGQGAGQEGTDGTGTVHRVRTLISGPPTAEGRPADFFYQPTGLHVRPGDVVRWEFPTPDHNVVSYHPAFGMRRRVPLGVDAFSSPLLGWRADSIPGDQVDPPAPMAEEGEGPPADEATGNETATPGNGTASPGNETATPETETGADTPAGAPATGRQAGPRPASWLHAFDTPGVYDILCSPHEVFGMVMRIVVGDETDAPFETADAEALPEPRVGPAELARETLTDTALAPETIVENGTVSWTELESVSAGGTGGEGDGAGTDTATPEGD